jgi:alpha-glucuronidase
MVESRASLPSRRTSRIFEFLTKRIALSAEELVALRDEIDAHLRKRVGVAPPSKRKTLYLPTDSLDEL